MPQLALDPTTGDLFTIWTNQGLGEREEILSRRWNQSAGVCTAIENLSQSPWEDRSPLLYFDSRGQGLLIWTRRYAASQGADADGTDLLWRAWDGAAWTAEGVLMHRDFFLPGAYGLIAVETPDTILLFITWSNSYRTTEYRSGIWAELTPWQYLSFEDPIVNPILVQILWDESGLLHAAALGENSSQQGADRYFYDAYYLAYDGSQWSTPFNVSATDGVASDLRLAFDGQGRLHFLWSDPDSPFSSESARSAIWGRVYEDGVWSPDNVEVSAYNLAQAIASFDLAAADGGLHLAWSEGIIVSGEHTDLDIYYRTGDGTAWDPEETVYTSTAKSGDPSLAVGGDGAALAWQEGTIPEQQIYFSQRYTSELSGVYLPLAAKQTP
jgi:hypothetical protein